MIDIVHINLSPLGKGGIERLLVEFYHYFHGKDMHHRFCILNSHNEVSLGLVNRGCVIDSMERSARGFDWGLYLRLYKFLKKSKPDIVHIHGNPGLLFGVPAARCAGIENIVYTCHFSQSGHSWLRHRLLGSLLSRTSARIAVSRAAQRVLVEEYHQPAERIQVIYNGVDTGRFAPSTRASRDGECTIGFCGVFRPEKQIPLLIRSVASMRRSGIGVKLLLVGDGPELRVCQETVADCGIRESVVFAGSQVDVQPFLAQMDIFVLPSREEAMPVALLEAMAQGCAAVGSNVGGIPEVIEDGFSGELVPSGNEFALTESLRRLVQDRELREQYGRAARARIENHFSLPAMMESYADLYQRLMQKQSHQRPSAVAGTFPPHARQMTIDSAL